MATTVISATNLVDSAIGPVSVTVAELNNFDIDDFVHTTVRAECIKLQLINKIQTADPSLATDRPPVTIDGNTIGGF